MTRRPGTVDSRIGESGFVTVEGIPEDEIVKIGFSDLGEIERERERERERDMHSLPDGFRCRGRPTEQ